MKKIVLFDLDGTLIKSGGVGLRALNAAFHKIYGRKKTFTIQMLVGNSEQQNIENGYRVCNGGKPSKKEIEKIESHYLYFLPTFIDEAIKQGKYKKVKGVDKLLNKLSQNKDVILSLATGNIKQGAIAKLKPFGLEKYFSFGSFAEDGYYRYEIFKSAVKKIESKMKIKVPKSEIFVVGDTLSDLNSAKKCGYHCSIVLCGYENRQLLKNASAGFISEDLSDIQSWLLWLGLQKDTKGVKRQCFNIPSANIEHVFYAKTGREVSNRDTYKLGRLCGMRRKRSAK